VATMTGLCGFAFDRASVRRYDADGRLHVRTAVLSMACVSPYLGSELPGWQTLDLDPDRTYRMLRDPDELRGAVGTFNNMPILSEHVAVDALDHHPELVIGSTGTEAEFDGTHLRNSLVFWAADAIRRIEDGTKAALSCGYRFAAEMDPGRFRGESYDGRMVNLCGNHVATVVDGRVPEAIVGDERLRFRRLSPRGDVLDVRALTRHIGADPTDPTITGE
jgi:uncharacterized protein